MELKLTYKQAPSSLHSNPQDDDLEEYVSKHLSEIHLVTPKSSLRSQLPRSTYHICQNNNFYDVKIISKNTLLVPNKQKLQNFDQEF